MRTALAVVLAVALAAGCGAQTHANAPEPPLRLGAAVNAGLDRGLLVAADRRFQATPGLFSVLVARRGRIVFERYYHGAGRALDWNVFSVTKSVVSALVGIALRDGRLHSLDQDVVDFFPNKVSAQADPRVRSITLRDLLTMTSGYRERHVAASDDWVTTSLNRPLASDPGTTFSYDSPSAHLVGAVVAQATGMPLATYAARELFTPLGIEPGGWETDGRGHQFGSTGLRLRARDLVRLGQLYLQHGRWHGRQIVPASWVRESTSRHVVVPGGYGYGYLWWRNRRSHGGYSAIGYGGQLIAVFPRLDLVVVTTGNDDAIDLAAIVNSVLRAAGR
jgi:CubicO group peptidase (beta-lactamase class C family)